MFLRTPAQWGQALLLCGVLLLYFTHFNMRQLGVRGAVVVSRDMSAFVNFIATALIVCTMTVRFAYPMVSLEGAAFWTLGALPIERRDIVEAKFFSVALASLLCGGTLVVASALSLGVASSVLALHLVGATALALGLSALSIGLGAAYPSFGETSAAKIASGFGGTVNLVASAGFCAFIVVFMVMPFHLRGGPALAPPFRQMWEYREWLAIGALAATLALLLTMGRVATQALETLEA